MTDAATAKGITNRSKARYQEELERIDREIISKANEGGNKLFTTAIIEVAQRIREELAINGYRVQNEQEDSSNINIEW